MNSAEAEREQMPPVRPDGLQLKEHRHFERKFWLAQRVAWVSFGVLMLAALAGLTGSGGPLSSASVATAAGRLDYPRVTRWTDIDTLHVTFGTGSGERTLQLSSSFLEAFQVEDVQPHPVRSVATADGQLLVFAADADGEIALSFRVRQVGLISFTASVDGGPPASMSTIGLP